MTTITQEEVQKFVDSLDEGEPSGIIVTIDTINEPTYEMEDGKPVRTKERQFVWRFDATGEHILHPLSRLHLKLGDKVTITIDLTVADGESSAHERTLRSRDDVFKIVKEQVDNLIMETVRKPHTMEEHRAHEAETIRLAAARAAADQVALAAQLKAVAPLHELKHTEYFEKYGEPDYFESGDHLEKHDKHLSRLVKSGRVPEEYATKERVRISEWRERCVQRRNQEGK